MINKDPNHKHTYDAQGEKTCCTLKEKIYTKAGAKELLKEGHIMMMGMTTATMIKTATTIQEQRAAAHLKCFCQQLSAWLYC